MIFDPTKLDGWQPIFPNLFKPEQPSNWGIVRATWRNEPIWFVEDGDELIDFFPTSTTHKHAVAILTALGAIEEAS